MFPSKSFRNESYSQCLRLSGPFSFYTVSKATMSLPADCFGSDSSFIEDSGMFEYLNQLTHRVIDLTNVDSNQCYASCHIINLDPAIDSECDQQFEASVLQPNIAV